MGHPAAGGVLDNLLNLFWIDLICLALICVFVNGAITGKCYIHGRGGDRAMIASVKPLWGRLAFLVVAGGLRLWVIVDLRHNFGLRLVDSARSSHSLASNPASSTLVESHPSAKGAIGCGTRLGCPTSVPSAFFGCSLLKARSSQPCRN